MRFDWQKFVSQYKIPYETRSSNVASNHIAVRCPFCGSADPSAHMGLSLDSRNPVWGCLRDTRHRGRNPVFLVMRLLGCSINTAREIVNLEYRPFGDDMAEETAKTSRLPSPGLKTTKYFNPRGMITSWEHEPGGKLQLNKDETTINSGEFLIFPNAIKPIDGKGYSSAFLDYLYDRGFPDPYLPVERADLHYSVAGKFNGRIIFPIKINRAMVTFTGRDITGRSELRYRTLPQEDELVNIKHCLYFEDEVAAGGETLFLTEGPIDALKLNCYLRSDFVATCFFGMPEPAQVIKLMCYAPRWRQMIVLLDPDVPTQRMALWYALSAARINVRYAGLPNGAIDPGMLTPNQVRGLAKNLLR